MIGVWNILMERRGRSSRSDIRRGRGGGGDPLLLPLPAAGAGHGRVEAGGRSEHGRSCKMGWDGMECKTKRAEEGRGAGIGIGFSRGRGVRSARLFPRGPLLLFQIFSTARSVEWSRGGLAFGRSEPLPLRCPALCLLSRHK
jgi:hypothetical protein